MNIYVNILEASAELANNDVLEEFDNNLVKVYKETEEGTTYTELAQDFFNDKYDYYYEVLSNLIIKE